MRKEVSNWGRYWMTSALFLILTSCNPASRYYDVVSQDNNILTYEIHGWTYSCENPKIYIQEGTSWVEADYPSYRPYGYYLDDQFQYLGMGCDINTCDKGCTRSLGLYKYVSTGDRKSPKDVIAGEGPSLVQSYRSEPLHGKIKIIFNVYQDPNGYFDCGEPIPVEFFINN
jgi:hypothetical protein